MQIPTARRFALPLLLLTCACSGAPAAAPAAADAAADPPLVGAVSRAEVEARYPEWAEVRHAAEIEPGTAQALAELPGGAEIAVYYGTWCSDSRREVPRFWRLLDEMGEALPFTVTEVAVDRSKSEPAELVAGSDLKYVPTFIVRRDGREVGRIVESPLSTLEEDLFSLIIGAAEGTLSGSQPQLMTPASDS